MDKNKYDLSAEIPRKKNSLFIIKKINKQLNFNRTMSNEGFFQRNMYKDNFLSQMKLIKL